MTINNIESWINYLPHTVYIRLTQCQTMKDDLPILLNAEWQWAQDTDHYNGYKKKRI